MRHFLAPLFIFLLPLGALLDAREMPFDTIIPVDVDVFLSLRDLSELREKWEAHPLVKDISQTSLAKFFESALGAADGDSAESKLKEWLEEFDLHETELMELFPGQIGLGVFNLPALSSKQTERLDWAVLAEFSGTPERLHELIQIQFKRNAEAQRVNNPAMEHEMIEEQFMGETLYFDQAFDGEKTYVEDAYALVDGIFILATPEERLRTIVESIKTDGVEPMARNEFYRRTQDVSGNVDLVFYLNLEKLMPGLQKVVLDPLVDGGLALFGVTGQSLRTALALDDMGALCLSCRLEEAEIRAHSSLVYREKSGLLSLLTYGQGTLPSASYLPTDLLSCTVALFDFSEMWRRFETLLAVASPSAPMLLQIQLQQIKTKTGVDLRAALMDNFSPELVQYSVLSEAGQREEIMVQPEQVYVFGIKDARVLSSAIEALKDMVPGLRARIQTREFEGEIIHTISGVEDSPTPGQTPYDFSFVVTRTHLIIGVGRAGMVHGLLTAMQSQKQGFWQRSDIRDLVEQVGQPGAISRSYTDFGQVWRTVFQSIKELEQLSGGNLKWDASIFSGDQDLPWHLLTETHEADDGIFTQMVLLRKEER